MLGMLAALALAASGPVLNADGLRRLEISLKKTPAAAPAPTRFSLDLPLVSDHKTDVGSLKNPAGWSYDRPTGVLTIDVDFGAVTPENYKAFDKQHLELSTPLRTLFFDTRTGKSKIFHEITDAKGQSDSQGWEVISESYGLAVPSSAKDYGRRGGDLPDAFVLPFLMKMNVPPRAVNALVASLRIRMEGELRTIGGRALLCSESNGDGYQVDEFTQTTPSVIVDRMCLAPAVLTRVALVRSSGGPPLKEWTRSDAEPTPEGAESAVIMAGNRNRAAPSIVQDTTATSASATAPLPAKH